MLLLLGLAKNDFFAANALSARLGTPFVARGADLNTVQDKNAFKKACGQCGIRVPKNYNETQQIDFPVIVKPVDNGGSKGIAICYDKKSLERSILKAKSVSIKGDCLIEEYLTGDEVMVYFNVYEGNANLSLMCDRIMHRFDDNITQLPIGYYFSSKHFQTFVDFNLPKFQNLIRKLGILNGLIAFQSFVIGNDVISFDPTYRLDGAMAYHVTEQDHGVSSLDNLILYGIGDLNSLKEREKREQPILKQMYFELPLLLGKGRIASIRGLNSISSIDGVYFVEQKSNVGRILEQKYDFSRCLPVFSFATTQLKD